MAPRATHSASRGHDDLLSADHLIRLEEERRGNREPERLSGLEIDDQLELRRLLHRQVGGLSPLEDLVHIDSSSAAEVARAWPVGHESTGLHKRAYVVHGRQAAR